MGMSGLREMLKALKKEPYTLISRAYPNIVGGLIYSQQFIHNKEQHYFPHSKVTHILTQQAVRKAEHGTRIDRQLKGIKTYL